jgi:hypothetical protein
MGGGAWPFYVGGVISLVNSVDERYVQKYDCDFSPYEYTATGGPLKSIFAIICEFTDLGVPKATLLKEGLLGRRGSATAGSRALRLGVWTSTRTQLCAVLKGLTKAFILENGSEALLPARRKPLGPDLLRRLLRTPEGIVLGTARVDWNSTIFLCLGGMFALGGGTGFLKSEFALPSQTAFEDRRLSRA